jgi:hypothetical protein
MKITKELLKEKGACAAGYRDFLKEYPVDKYPDGVEYQELLDCCAEKNFSYGSWLLGAFGKTDEVRKIDGDLIVEKGIIFAGRLEVKGCIKAGCGIKAGWGIKAGRGIEAGEGIEAGCGIEAGEGIEAGCGIEAGMGIEAGDEFGIYAGLRCRITNKTQRKIIAKNRPENIMCGEFEEKKDDAVR